MLVNDFDYDLPEELIAQTPLDARDESRLMVLDPVDETIVHSHFNQLMSYLVPGDLLVFNNSKVLPARLYGKKSDTGANIELLLTRAVSETDWICMAKPAKRLKQGSRITFEVGPDNSAATAEAVVTDVLEEGLRLVHFEVAEPMEAFLNRVGSMPLPPYIHAPLKEASRYQTVYAEPPGSVAAPTAGLHFTEKLLDQVRANGVDTCFVTLHVGLGTFKPMQTEVVEEHVMHKEEYEVSPETAAAISQAKREGRRVIAVGTTALRTLESAAEGTNVRSGRSETGIFIYPGYEFQVADALITNFHLPKSTLVMLVSAFMGTAFTRTVYQTAVAERYRFFSFGDAMFITRRGPLVNSTRSL